MKITHTLNFVPNSGSNRIIHKHTIFTKIFGIRKESSKGPAPKGD